MPAVTEDKKYPPQPDPADLVWQREDEDPEQQKGGEVEYDFGAPDPEDG